MTLEIFDQFPGHSKGYAGLSEEMRRQFTLDIPHWSEFIKREANRFNYPYIDMSDGFQSRLMEAGDMLTKL